VESKSKKILISRAESHEPRRCKCRRVLAEADAGQELCLLCRALHLSFLDEGSVGLPRVMDEAAARRRLLGPRKRYRHPKGYRAGLREKELCLSR